MQGKRMRRFRESEVKYRLKEHLRKYMLLDLLLLKFLCMQGKRMLRLREFEVQYKLKEELRKYTLMYLWVLNLLWRKLGMYKHCSLRSVLRHM